MDPMGTNERLVTAEDLLRDPQYERGELWDGVFVVREPAGGYSGALEFRIAIAVGKALEAHPGWAFGAEQGFFVSRDPDRVLSPDVSYVSPERLPAVPRTGFIEGAPDFAVEVRSPTDAWIATIEKGGVWIGHGVRVVWCIDSLSQHAVVMRPGQPPVECRPGDRLDARPVLDLLVPLADLFAGLP